MNGPSSLISRFAASTAIFAAAIVLLAFFSFHAIRGDVFQDSFESPLDEWSLYIAGRIGEDPGIVCYLIRECFTAMLVGADPFAVKNILARADVAIRGYPYTKAMIESALFDIMGRSLGVPVYQLLGGAVRTEIPLCHSVGIAPPELAAEEAAQVAADGIRWLQIKVPGEPAEDLAIVKAIRRAVGDGVTIFPDINRGYKSVKPPVSQRIESRINGKTIHSPPRVVTGGGAHDPTRPVGRRRRLQPTWRPSCGGLPTHHGDDVRRHLFHNRWQRPTRCERPACGNSIPNAIPVDGRDHVQCENVTQRPMVSVE